jgi:hypothetical protein
MDHESLRLLAESISTLEDDITSSVFLNSQDCFILRELSCIASEHRPNFPTIKNFQDISNLDFQIYSFKLKNISTISKKTLESNSAELNTTTILKNIFLLLDQFTFNFTPTVQFSIFNFLKHPLQNINPRTDLNFNSILIN